MAARFAFIALALVLLHLGTEAWLHRRRLRRIPLRIHVNGTRGKTSVTRLLAATLRQAGIRTLAKVTGDEPRLILPDGTEQKIERRGPARIQEQIWFIRPAAFVNVGGAMTSLGAVREAPLFPAGLITTTDRTVDPRRGLIARMVEQRVPVIHLLDIRHLAGKYGLPIDPVPLPPVPAGMVMKPGRYARAGASGGLLALALILAWTDRRIRQTARAATAAQPVRT